MTHALGVDISKWNGNWDAAKAKQAGVTFVTQRLSYGLSTGSRWTSWNRSTHELGN